MKTKCFLILKCSENCVLPASRGCYALRSAVTLRLLAIFITSLATRTPQNFPAIWEFSQGKSCRMHESNTILSFGGHISPGRNVWRVGEGLMCGARLDAVDLGRNSVKDWEPLGAAAPRLRLGKFTHDWGQKEVCVRSESNARGRPGRMRAQQKEHSRTNEPAATKRRILKRFGGSNGREKNLFYLSLGVTGVSSLESCCESVVA